MNAFRALLVAFCLAQSTGICRAASPVQKVVILLGNLEQKIIKDGEEEKKAFEAYMAWCKDGAKDKEFEIKTAKSSIEDLTATINKADSDIATLSSKIGDLVSSISTNDADLKAAAAIREKELKDFTATEEEMTDTVDTLERAINILERKLHGSNLLQAKVDRKDVAKLIQVLGNIIDAAALSLHDKKLLLGLVQNNEQSDEDDEELGAPAPDAYKSHSGSIVDVLEDLKQKAITELEQARREETNARHNFELLKQSLEDQIEVDNKQMAESKTAKHDAFETKATSAGDLTVAKQDLADAESVLKSMKGDCAARAADRETSAANREEELKAIAAAKKAIMEMTGNAQGIVYGAASFLQLEGGEREQQQLGLRTSTDLANFEVVNLVRKLAREQKSAELAQLAQRISTAMRVGVKSGEDPFAKVKQLISDMIERLNAEAGQEAQHKAYCDKEYKETKQKLDELKYDIEKYTSKIDKSKADSVLLKDEVATLQGEIAEILKTQTVADALRKEEYKVYVQSKADLEQGLQGVRMALKILRDYYANAEQDGAAASSFAQQPDAPGVHSQASGVGTSVIGMLEVVESDFGKTLASTEMTEESAATAYQKLSMENKLSRSLKEKDVEYKTKEAASLDKSVAELTSDRDSAQTELDAVLQYSANIRNMCEVKPESYEERKARREAEISGLKEALQILEGESVFLQKRQKGTRRHFRSGLRGMEPVA